MTRFIKSVFIVFAFLALFISCKKKSTYTEEQLKAQKIAFFTEKLELTPEEAKTFWPVYDDYWERKNKIIAEKRAAMKFCKNNLSGMPQEELSQYADMYISFQKQEADLLLEFNEKFKSVLPPGKVLKLYITDYDFKNYLFHQLKESKKK